MNRMVGFLESVFNVYANLYFMVHFTVVLLFAICVVCGRSVFRRENLVVNLRVLRDDTVEAHLGDALR